MYVTQIYCDNPECNVRQVEIRTKDYDQPDPEIWSCPACGKHAKINWRGTVEERQRHELALAIGRVNAALYQRDMPDKLAVVPMNVLALDELPAHWKAQT